MPDIWASFERNFVTKNFQKPPNLIALVRKGNLDVFIKKLFALKTGGSILGPILLAFIA